jgi:hypothetical protein
MHLRLVLPVLAIVLGACFNVVPVTGTPPQGADLEAVLSDSGTIALTPRIGPNAASLTGTLTAARGDTLDIAIAEVRTRDGLTYYLKGTTVSLVRSDLSALRMRQLNKPRTIIAATVGVVGAAALAAGVKAITGGSGTDGGGGGTPAARPPE